MGQQLDMSEDRSSLITNLVLLYMPGLYSDAGITKVFAWSYSIASIWYLALLGFRLYLLNAPRIYAIISKASILLRASRSLASSVWSYRNWLL